MKVAVLLSGGVDSSVALARLVEAGHDVTAFYLKIWLEDELSFLGSCPWEEDLSYARRVCEQFNVPLEIINLQREYKERIVSYTIAEVQAGRTPSPDIFCNQKIKFGAFFEALTERGYQFDKIASGHYAQVLEPENENKSERLYQLRQAPDPVKDQTYFLSFLSQEQLSKILFPIGDLKKSEVRELAQKYNLATRDRKDSQGICFLGKISFNDFIKQYIGEKPGDLIEYETGETVGTHKGFWFHTIGQRRGLGLSGGPWYVVSKDVGANQVFISRNYYDTSDTGKQRNSFTVSSPHWIAGVSPKSTGNTTDLKIKLRHGPEFHRGTVTYNSDGSLSITLAERDQGIAPGQSAVFYDGAICLGAGLID